jgi:molecular chaperone DnaK (HSP70)
MSDRGLLINAIGLVDAHGGTNIPTVLYYRKDQSPAFGSEALGLKRNRRELNEDFKIDLGNIKPGTTGARRLFVTSTGVKKSAAELTADFIHEMLECVTEWMAARDLKKAPSIMVAEPLSMLAESSSTQESEGSSGKDFEVKQGELVSKEWLHNYRSNLKRILLGKGFVEERIKFLPEPFAVFQYYRHGRRHPLVAERKKHNALVLDFGGGTFDVCVIETTKEGEIDINDARRLSKARSAASKPIGGFYVNRMIVEALLRKYLNTRHLAAKLHTGLELYRKWRRNEISLAGIAEEQKEFIQQFDSLCHEIEDAKLALSRSITDWRLDSSVSVSVPVVIPENPFVATSPMVNCQLSANEFREIFVKRVWEQQLRDVVKKALDRGREELSGAPITVVLLSGGSANIKWIRELLRHDFHEELTHQTCWN